MLTPPPLLEVPDIMSTFRKRTFYVLFWDIIKIEKLRKRQVFAGRLASAPLADLLRRHGRRHFPDVGIRCQVVTFPPGFATITQKKTVLLTSTEAAAEANIKEANKRS